ncbi:ATP-dependent DNA ligase [Pseudonocardia yuanmonensis]|uniref:ATP-dependent DNA ligase n=1 Tax=Pseudonocardia yuanmonensis TaxID=1095914 RepID=A0ABP8WMZ2_9PSEU
MRSLPYPLEPMVAVRAEDLPVGEKWIYEPKFDGFRCLAHAAGGRIRLQSRQKRSLTRYFPEIVAAVAALGEDVVLDGELVIWQQGRLAFDALQDRIHPSTAHAGRLAAALPAAFVVFDLLAHEGADLRPLPYAERRRRLEELLGTRLPHGLVLVPASTDVGVGRLWQREHTASGIEGVVAKRVDQTYRAGSRSWRKVRTRLTAEAVVGGVLGSLEDPEALVVGRFGRHGRLRVAGRTTPLGGAARTHLRRLLSAADAEHPWPTVLPPSRFGQRPGRPVEYVQVRPSVVVELEVDAAYEQDRWRHPVRFLRSRPDLRPEEIARAATR